MSASAESVASDSSDWSYVGESKQDNSDSSESDNDGGGGMQELLFPVRIF